MTVQERQEIFAKEYLSINDIQKLFDFNYPQASQFILDIKTKFKIDNQPLRLKVQGKIHIQDYLDFIGVKSDRYGTIAEQSIKV